MTVQTLRFTPIKHSIKTINKIENLSSI